jgi:hypothetical protein
MCVYERKYIRIYKYCIEKENSISVNNIIN